MASTMFYYGCDDHRSHHEQTHFLESCSMCQKPLGLNRDIFMYRGNTAFCSDECRQEQIEMDEAEERSWRRRAQRKAAKKPAGGPSLSATASTATDSKSAVSVA